MTESTPKPAPSGLRDRGNALWTTVCAEASFDAAGYAMLEDACRTADIISQLNSALHSKHQEWVKLAEDSEELPNGTMKVMVVVNPLLGEIRQQRLALRQLLAHLHIGKVSGGSTTPTENFWGQMEKEFA